MSRTQITVTFDSPTEQHATALADALRDAITTSDALPKFPEVEVSEPIQMDPPWPKGSMFQDWQYEVGNGDTTLGFHAWAVKNRER